MSLKFTNLGQQPNNQLSNSSENFRADKYSLAKQFNPLSELLLMLWFQSYKPKSTFYPYVLFLAMAAILVCWQGHRTHFLN